MSFNNWEKVDQELEKVEKWGINLLPLSDPDYPKALFQTCNPPMQIYVKGKILGRDEMSTAIVESRLTDSYGRAVAQALSTELSSHGV